MELIHTKKICPLKLVKSYSVQEDFEEKSHFTHQQIPIPFSKTRIYGEP